MAAPRLSIVGFTTSTRSRVTVVADAPNAWARIAWRDGAGVQGTADVPLVAAPPVRIGSFDLAGLTPSGRVEYAIDVATAQDLLQVPGLAGPHVRSFRLLPARPLRIGLVSCNGVHTVAEEARRYAMWRVLKQRIDRDEIDLVLYMGDQIYADPIWQSHDADASNMNLDPSNAARVAALTAEYRALYAKSWSAPDVSAVLSSCPSLMMWDDHDIFDGWGSNDEDDEPPQRAFFAAARAAFADFQARNNPPPIDPAFFTCGFDYRDVAILLVDARTNRLYEKGRIVGAAHWTAIRSWLAALAQKPIKHLFVVLGVPPVHVEAAWALDLLERFPAATEPLDDLRDAWMAPQNAPERALMLDVLFEFGVLRPGAQVTIVGGDVHTATLGQIDSNVKHHLPPGKKAARIHQIITSGIGYDPPSGVIALGIRLASKKVLTLSGKGKRKVTGKLLAAFEDKRRILLERNIGIVRMSDATGNAFHPAGTLTAEIIGEGMAKSVTRELKRV